MTDQTPPIDSERAQMIRELRERYLNGSIDDVLIPEDADLSPLLDDLRKPETEVRFQRIDGGRNTRSEEIA